MYRFVVLALVLAAFAAPASAKDRCRGAALPAPDALAAPGPHDVGRRTFTFVDESRPTMANGTYPGAPSRTLATEVWFPAGSPGGSFVDNAQGPYPLILHSHGFLDSRTGMAYLGEHLASHGYVVAAVDYPLSNGGAPGGATVLDVSNQPGDASFVIDRLLAMSADVASPLAGGIDANRIGASGLSLGGLTTLLVTYHRDLRDTRIKAALPMAPAGCMFTERFFRTTRTPLLVMHGDSDLLLPWREYGARSFQYARGRRHFVLLEQGSHTGFTGVAVAFDQTKHFDRIGCLAIGNAGAVQQTTGAGGNMLGAYGTKKAGVLSTPKRCPEPCSEPIVDPSMGAARHHTLTRITAKAFFDGYLRDDVGSRCYLALDLRDQPDVTVRSR